jgi:hypothetical protein
MPTAREFPAAGVVGGRLYAVGGFSGGFSNKVEAFNPKSCQHIGTCKLLAAEVEIHHD